MFKDNGIAGLHGVNVGISLSQNLMPRFSDITKLNHQIEVGRPKRT